MVQMSRLQKNILHREKTVYRDRAISYNQQNYNKKMGRRIQAQKTNKKIKYALHTLYFTFRLIKSRKIQAFCTVTTARLLHHYKISL